MGLRDTDHSAVYSWLGALERKSRGGAPMVFPATGGQGQGGWASFWGTGAVGLEALLPGSQYDYASEAGDLWLNSAIAACMGWIQDNFSEPVLQVRKAPHGDAAKARPVPSALVGALDEPNPDYDGDALWAATLLSYLCAGNAYWIKAKSPSGRKMFLYYAPHWEVEPRWNAGDGTQFIDHYDHVVDGRRYPLRRDQVVHFRHGLNPRQVRSGLAQLTPVLREVCTDNQANTYSAAILRNWGVPGVVVTPEDDNVTLDAAEQDNIKAKWREQTTGDNVGSALVNSVNLRIQQLGLSPDKMALDVIRRIPEARICAALKIPPTVVGLSVGEGQRSYANTASDERKAYRNCLVPLQKSFARALTRQLLPDFGGGPNESVAWDYSGVEAMAEDVDRKAKRVVLVFAGGLAKRDEARAMLGMDPVGGPEGDEYGGGKTPPGDGPADPEKTSAETNND